MASGLHAALVVSGIDVIDLRTFIHPVVEHQVFVFHIELGRDQVGLGGRYAGRTPLGLYCLVSSRISLMISVTRLLESSRSYIVKAGG